MLSHIAQALANAIAAQYWSDAPHRMDRAGHRRVHDANKGVEPQELTAKETDYLRWNIAITVAQVLWNDDPHFDPHAFMAACGVESGPAEWSPGFITAGLRNPWPPE